MYKLSFTKDALIIESGSDIVTRFIISRACIGVFKSSRWKKSSDVGIDVELRNYNTTPLWAGRLKADETAKLEKWFIGALVDPNMDDLIK